MNPHALASSFSVALRLATGTYPKVLLGTLFLHLVAPLPTSSQQSVLETYDLSSGAGHRVELPGVLQEISGLATTSDGRLFGHEDERAIIYELDVDEGSILKAFAVGSSGVPGDYEGLAVAGDRFFLLTSEGRILEFQEGEHGSAVGYRTHSLNLASVCEMEGLAFDPTDEALLMACKTPRSSDLRKHLVVFSVPLSTMKVQGPPRIFIPLADLDHNGLGDEFHPSAIEVHPETGSFLLLAAREEALVELSRTGEIVKTKEFKRKNHPQPEGLAFLPDGRMIVADEGQGERGTLTSYGPKKEGGGLAP